MTEQTGPVEEPARRQPPATAERDEPTAPNMPAWLANREQGHPAAAEAITKAVSLLEQGRGEVITNSAQERAAQRVQRAQAMAQLATAQATAALAGEMCGIRVAMAALVDAVSRMDQGPAAR